MHEWYDDDLALTHTRYEQGDIAGGMAACERLLSRPDLPWTIEQLVLRNQTWHLQPLALTGNAAFREPPYQRAELIRVGHNLEGWTRFNPSIATNPAGEQRIIVRSANYRIDTFGRYVMQDGGDVIKTKNYFGRVGSMLHEIRAPARVTESQRDYLVQGFEDARLFWTDGHWMFSATVRDRHPHGMCQIALCELSDDGEILSMDLQSDGQRHEKNWMPVVDHARNPRWVYQCSPLMVFYENLLGYWWPGLHIARNWRGGSQVVRLPNLEGRLCLVHEAVNFDAPPRRVYMHRFVEFSAGLGHITRYSAPFCFHERGIEFAAGLILDGSDAVISYGRGDESAWLLRLPLAEIDAMLHDPLVGSEALGLVGAPEHLRRPTEQVVDENGDTGLAESDAGWDLALVGDV